MGTSDSLAFAFRNAVRYSKKNVFKIIESTHSQLFQGHAQLETLTIYGHLNRSIRCTMKMVWPKNSKCVTPIYGCTVCHRQSTA